MISKRINSSIETHFIEHIMASYYIYLHIHYTILYTQAYIVYTTYTLVYILEYTSTYIASIYSKNNN